MNFENRAHVLQASGMPARTASWLRPVGIVLAGSAFAAACAHVALPLAFTPVPLTLQPFAVLVLGLLLAPRLAGAALAAYLVEGAIGLPVFSPAAAGPGLLHLFGPTGGYLLAYPLAAMAISWIWRRQDRTYTAALLSAAVGDAIVLLGGAAWLAVLTHAPAQAVFTQSVVPFVPGDALKVIAAASLVAGGQRLRRRMSTTPSTL